MPDAEDCLSEPWAQLWRLQSKLSLFWENALDTKEIFSQQSSRLSFSYSSSKHTSPPLLFLKDLIFKLHETLGNGNFALLTAMQVKNYYSCIILQHYTEIYEELCYQVLYNEHISSNPHN